MSGQRSLWYPCHGLALVCALLAGHGCGGDGKRGGKASDEVGAKGAQPPQGSESAESAGPRGTLRVRVRWPEADAHARSPAGRNPCGHMRRAPVSIHTLGGVSDVVVEVRALASDQGQGQGQDQGQGQENDTAASASASGRDVPAPAELAIADCRPGPRVVLAPPAHRRVAVCNHDETRHRVELSTLAGDTLASAQLALIGACAAFELPGAGSWRVRTDADGDEYAYIRAPASERFTLTNGRGVAVFDDLAPGAYQVSLWYPPTAAGASAIERSQRVAIRADKTEKLTFDIAEP